MGNFFRSHFGGQEKEQGHGQKLSKREGKINLKLGFSAQETKHKPSLEREVALGPADLVPEF